MAVPGQINEGSVRSLQTPGLSLLSLPAVIHRSIASFLPDGNKKHDSRLRVSEASRALLDFYGGSLDRMWISYF